MLPSGGWWIRSDRALLATLQWKIRFLSLTGVNFFCATPGSITLGQNSPVEWAEYRSSGGIRCAQKEIGKGSKSRGWGRRRGQGLHLLTTCNKNQSWIIWCVALRLVTRHSETWESIIRCLVGASWTIWVKSSEISLAPADAAVNKTEKNNCCCDPMEHFRTSFPSLSISCPEFVSLLVSVFLSSDMFLNWYSWMKHIQWILFTACCNSSLNVVFVCFGVFNSNTLLCECHFQIESAGVFRAKSVDCCITRVSVYCRLALCMQGASPLLEKPPSHPSHTATESHATLWEVYATHLSDPGLCQMWRVFNSSNVF